MIYSNPQTHEAGNGFDQIRARIEQEYAGNVEVAQEALSLPTLSSLQRLHEEVLSQLAAAEDELRVFYELGGRDVGESLVALCDEEGLGDDGLVALTQEVVFAVQDGLTVGEITDQQFTQQPQNNVPLFDQDECVRLARNGLSYRIAEQLGLM
ncbi:MAG: hypothetical protein QG553_918 [Patescibacteria group bacterium]|nr:hypothetical protein [Patescibacteria group bacterium]